MAKITDNMDLSNLSSTEIQNSVTDVRTVIKQALPTLDTTPDSVFGNLFVVPSAKTNAAFEKAKDCLLSDLIISNIAQGKVCDCDFVKEYIKNFGISTLEDGTLPIQGVVRLLFNTNKQYTIDRGMMMVFNEDYLCNFWILGKNNTDIVVYPAERPFSIRDGFNTFRLSPYSASDGEQGEITQWYVDLPVYTSAASQISAGDIATYDLAIDELISITAVTDMSTDTTEEQPVERMANLAQQVFPSSNMTTKGNAVSFAMSNFYNSISTACVVDQNDAEIKDASKDVMNVNSPKVDIYTQPKNLVEATSVVKLARVIDVVTTRNEDGKVVSTTYVPTNKWLGAMNFTSAPYSITKVQTMDGEYSVPFDDNMKFLNTDNINPFSGNENIFLNITDESGELLNNSTLCNTNEGYMPEINNQTTTTLQWSDDGESPLIRYNGSEVLTVRWGNDFGYQYATFTFYNKDGTQVDQQTGTSQNFTIQCSADKNATGYKITITKGINALEGGSTVVDNSTGITLNISGDEKTIQKIEGEQITFPGALSVANSCNEFNQVWKYPSEDNADFEIFIYDATDYNKNGDKANVIQRIYLPDWGQTYIRATSGLTGMTGEPSRGLTADVPYYITLKPKYYTFVQVTYTYNPIALQLSELINSDEISPVIPVTSNVPFPLYINNLNIKYTKKAGMTIDRQAVRVAILDYMNHCLYPEIYSDSRIAEIMTYYGATSVEEITANCTVCFDIADKGSTDGTSSSGNPYRVSTTNLLYSGKSPDGKWTIGDKNRGYYLENDNITFDEVVI